MKNGATTEISLIGKEGMIGVPVVLGGESINYEAIVRVTGTAMRIEAKTLKQHFERFPELRKIILLFKASIKAHLEVFSAQNITTVLTDTIPCYKLKVKPASSIV